MNARSAERLGVGLGLAFLVGMVALMIHANSVDRAAIQTMLETEIDDPAIEQQLEALQSLSALLRDNASVCGDVQNPSPCPLPINPNESSTQ